MPHAFRSAALIEAENAQRKLDRLRDRWLASKDSWFDGSAESVERRIANTDEVTALCKSIGSRLHAAKVGSDALTLLPILAGQRRELENMRSRIAGSLWEHEHDPRDQRGLDAIPTTGDPDGQYGIRTQLTQDYANQGNAKEDVQNAILDKLRGQNVGPNDFDQRTDQTRAYAGEQEHQHGPYVDEALHSAAREWVADQNSTDAGELRIRAERYVEARTGSWTPESAHAAKRDFLAAVSAATPRPVRTAARVEASVIEDFDDALMFS